MPVCYIYSRSVFPFGCDHSACYTAPPGKGSIHTVLSNVRCGIQTSTKPTACTYKSSDDLKKAAHHVMARRPFSWRVREVSARRREGVGGVSSLRAVFKREEMGDVAATYALRKPRTMFSLWPSRPHQNLSYFGSLGSQLIELSLGSSTTPLPPPLCSAVEPTTPAGRRGDRTSRVEAKFRKLNTSRSGFSNQKEE